MSPSIRFSLYLRRRWSCARLRVIWRNHGRKLDWLRSFGRWFHALRKASCAMSSLAGTSRVIASAIAVMPFWQPETMRPNAARSPFAAAGSCFSISTASASAFMVQGSSGQFQ
jgi:hypothetical protein